jgi:hypothetical protein
LAAAVRPRRRPTWPWWFFLGVIVCALSVRAGVGPRFWPGSQVTNSSSSVLNPVLNIAYLVQYTIDRYQASSDATRESEKQKAAFGLFSAIRRTRCAQWQRVGRGCSRPSSVWRALGHPCVCWGLLKTPYLPRPGASRDYFANEKQYLQDG